MNNDCQVKSQRYSMWWLRYWKNHQYLYIVFKHEAEMKNLRIQGWKSDYKIFLIRINTVKQQCVITMTHDTSGRNRERKWKVSREIFRNEEKRVLNYD